MSTDKSSFGMYQRISATRRYQGKPHTHKKKKLGSEEPQVRKKKPTTRWRALGLLVVMMMRV
jgi:hypothetical protein